MGFEIKEYSRKEILEERIQDLKNKKKKQDKDNKKYTAMTIFSFVLAAIGTIFSCIMCPNWWKIYPELAVIPLCFFLYPALFLTLRIIRPDPNIESELRQTQDEYDLVVNSEYSLEEKAEKQFKLHQYILDRYYDQSLTQGKKIFSVGISCIIVGFLIMIGIILFAVFLPENQNKYLIGSLGGLSSILSGYIGTIYMKMYSETIKSLNEFHNRLVYTHNLHFSNFFASKIENKELREKTIADIALKIANERNGVKN
ncbi:TRADD-N-associated membrane domain-containing protein [Methanococcus sp. CF]